MAVCWWRVHPGKEDQFRKGWHGETELIIQIYSSYGSRLRDRDGRFVGYANWPDAATWLAVLERKTAHDEPETRAAIPRLRRGDTHLCRPDVHDDRRR